MFAMLIEDIYANQIGHVVFQKTFRLKLHRVCIIIFVLIYFSGEYQSFKCFNINIKVFLYIYYICIYKLLYTYMLFF